MWHHVKITLLLCLAMLINVNSLTCSSSFALTSPRRSNYSSGRRGTITLASSASHLETGRSSRGVLENCFEATVGTINAYISGYITGLVWGAIMGSTWARVPDVGFFSSVRTKSVQMGGTWGMLTASFQGFTAISRVLRGRDDEWDQIFGACGAGAFLCKDKGPQAMAQGCLSYGLLSYLFASMGKKDELDVVDIPVNTFKEL
ncbi:unnamed protein product [Choristocarpus tenellus]